MALTIHYRLATDLADSAAIQPLVQRWRDIARQLPFQNVNEVVELRGEECRSRGRDDPHRWLKIQAVQFVQEAEEFVAVPPRHIVAFATVPGAGCEPANFGLCLYPEYIHGETANQTVRTNLASWNWSSFCKTQYAAHPNNGGVANFVRCHLAVIALLDVLRDRRLASVQVNDQSGYATHRDLRTLVAALGKWNENVESVARQIQDATRAIE